MIREFFFFCVLAKDEKCKFSQVCSCRLYSLRGEIANLDEKIVIFFIYF